MWSWTADGIYSIKVVSSVLDNVVFDLSQSKSIWSSLVPKKVNILISAKGEKVSFTLQVAARLQRAPN